MKKYVFLLILSSAFLISNSVCFSQQSKIDSLLILLKTDKADTNKLIHLYNLSDEYETSENYPDGLNYGKQALTLAEEILTKSDFSKEKSLIYSAKKYKAKAYNNIGLIYYDQGNYPEALKNYLTSLKIREDIGDKIGAALSYNNIGIVYYFQSNFPEALKNHFAALKIRKAIGNQKGIAASYNNIGNVYYKQKNYPEALKNYFASLKINEPIGEETSIAASYNNIGNVYSDQGNYPAALKNYFTCVKIYESISSKTGISDSYINIGSVYISQKKYKEAVEYLIIGKELSEETGNKENLKAVYSTLTELYSANGNFKKAYENNKLYILYRDSLDNEQTRKKTIQSQMNFDFEKKEAVATAEHEKELENQHILAEEKSRKQKIILLFVLGSLLLVLVFAGFIFRSLKVTKKQKSVIEEQKGIVEHQKHLVEEHQKEIVDSITYAKRIQYTLLANKQLLDANLSEHFILFKPKDIVSGDFYWATKKTGSIQTTNGKEEIIERFYIAACDSTGHGVPGAFMSLLNISFLNEAVNEKNIIEPHEILNHVRKRLIENMDGGQDGMDCILLCFETAALSERAPLSFGEGPGVRCTYAAANNSPAIIQNGKLISLEADKMPVGKGENEASFTLRTIDLSSYSEQNKKSAGNVAQRVEPKVLPFGEDLGGASFLYLYTDGYADQFGGPKGKKFKYKQLDELLISISTLPANEQSELLNQRFEDWKGDLEQVDDVLIIGIKI